MQTEPDELIRLRRTPLTIDIHHLDYVSEGGNNEPDNLLPLCPNCHSLHHKGNIPIESLRAWKFLLLSLNEAFDKQSIDILLTLDKLDNLRVSGEGMLTCASLLASGLISSQHWPSVVNTRYIVDYEIKLSEKGKTFVEAWKQGDQRAAVETSA